MVAAFFRCFVIIFLYFTLLLYIKKNNNKKREEKNPKGPPKYNDNNDKIFKKRYKHGVFDVSLYFVTIFLIMTRLCKKTLQTWDLLLSLYFVIIFFSNDKFKKTTYLFNIFLSLPVRFLSETATRSCFPVRYP